MYSLIMINLLSLTLLVAWIRADNAKSPASFDRLAFRTDFLD